MRIDHFTIRNFHGIEYAEYDLHPKTTLLVGDNATGKSAILDALAVLAGSYFLGLDGVASLTIKNDDIRQEMRFESDGSTQRIPHVPASLEAEGEVHGKPLKWSRERFGFAKKTRQAGAKKIADLAQKTYANIIDGRIETRPFLGYYSVARLGTQKKETSNRKQALKDPRAGYMNCLDKGSSQWAAERWFAGLQSRSQSAIGEASAIFEMAKRKLLSLFKSLDRALSDIHYDAETDEIFVRFDKATGFIPLSYLSSGYKSVLFMGLDFLYRIFILNPHLGSSAFDETPGLALIDETDMHLHPKWQGHVINDIREAFPALQFVFTTHSAFVVQSLRNGSVINLDTDNAQDIDDHIKKSIPEVAEDFMGMENVERSKYFLDQIDAAEKYFTLLKQSPKASQEELAALKAQLDKFEIRYNRDPAFIGLLRAERNASLGNKA